ncbi:response regulator transcription factor [Proteiniphilum sp.]|uniref:response regulator transcription factor n=1 Tax=Proteiniphilum sp. TaxID=1926877 RepID=UPI00332AADF5
MDTIKIILVDDDLKFGKMQSMTLARLGYKVHFQTSLAGIEEAIRNFSPSTILLDVEIGEENGIKKAKELIVLFPDIPILFVSSHHEIDYVTEGIGAGGVHYLKKPFDIKELDVYIKRFANKRSVTKEIPIGNYLLNSATRQLYYDDTLLGKLQPLEKNMLVLLWKNKNEPLSNETLSNEIWGKEYTAKGDPSIMNAISKLRKFFKQDAQVRIDTIKYKGYQLTIS